MIYRGAHEGPRGAQGSAGRREAGANRQTQRSIGSISDVLRRESPFLVGIRSTCACSSMVVTIERTRVSASSKMSIHRCCCRSDGDEGEAGDADMKTSQEGRNVFFTSEIKAMTCFASAVRDATVTRCSC